jgi:hypothetical protein
MDTMGKVSSLFRVRFGGISPYTRHANSWGEFFGLVQIWLTIVFQLSKMIRVKKKTKNISTTHSSVAQPFFLRIGQ